jgi:hypothetical protein
MLLLAACLSGCAPSLARYRELGSEGRIDTTASVIAKASIEIHATPREAWDILTHARAWPEWNKEIKSVDVSGNREPGTLDSGTAFIWGPASPRIRSQVVRADSGRELVWVGTMMHIKAIHRWRIRQHQERIIVETEESLEGFGVSILYGRKKLRRNLESWLLGFKKRAERLELKQAI